MEFVPPVLSAEPSKNFSALMKSFFCIDGVLFYICIVHPRMYSNFSQAECAPCSSWQAPFTPDVLEVHTSTPRLSRAETIRLLLHKI